MKKIILGALVLFIFSFSFKLFLEWDTDNEHRHALMLEGFHIEDVSTTYDPSQNLVPEGSILTEGDVDSITYTHDLLVMPDRTIDSEFERLVLRTADGEVADEHGLFKIESETLAYETLDDAPHDRMTIQSTITLSQPDSEAEDAFLKSLRSLSFDVSLNASE